MTWSFSAHGLAKDEQAAARLLAELRELFSDTGHGTLSTSFSAPGISEANFHAVEPAEPPIPAPPEVPDTGTEQTPAEGDGQAEEHADGNGPPAG